MLFSRLLTLHSEPRYEMIIDVTVIAKRRQHAAHVLFSSLCSHLKVAILFEVFLIITFIKSRCV